MIPIFYQLFDNYSTPFWHYLVIVLTTRFFHVTIQLLGGGDMTYNGSPDKTRTNITIDKELKAKLEKIAKSENRSFNNLVITVLQKFAEEHK